MANYNSFYTVKKGDTLANIAQNFGTSALQLQQINGLKNSNHIEEGQIIALTPKAVCKVGIKLLDRDREPIANAKIKIEYGQKKKEFTTKQNGTAPIILTKTPEDRVRVHIARADGSWKQLVDTASDWGNKIITMVSPNIKAEGQTIPHPKDTSGKPLRDPKSLKAEPPQNALPLKQWSYGDGNGPKTEVVKDENGLPIQKISNEPRTIVKPEEGLVPWMNHALGEAGRFKGSKEDAITKSINYHKEIGTSLKTLVGDKNAWCASFANWCILQAGYPIQHPKNSGLEDRRTLADGFRQTHKGKKSIANPLFTQISEPVYGAIAVVVLPKGARDDRPGKHVGFVYGRSSKNKISILGGNQSDKICFSDYNEKEVVATVSNKDKKTGKKITTTKRTTHLEFYLPTLYLPIYNKNVKSLQNVNTKTANSNIGITKVGRQSDR